MATKYQLQGNALIENVPTIGNLVYDELGQEILAKFNERFRGIKGVEFSRQETPKKDEPVRYSNVPRALGIDQVLREQHPSLDLRVLSPEQVVRFWSKIPDLSSTYADTNSIVIYPNQGANEDLRQRVLKQLGKTSKYPLVVSGLGVELDVEGPLGFTLTRTDYTQAQEAEFLTQDGNVSYNANKDKLERTERGVYVYTANDQSGLRGLYRGGGNGLGAWVGSLLDAGGNGRVQLIQDLQGRAENLEEVLQKSRIATQEQIALIAKRGEEALKYIRTGKL